MYSGITQGLYEVIALKKAPGLLSYTVLLSSELARHLKPGDSVSVDGVCQTVVTLEEETRATFQAIQETLEKTTLNELYLGSYVSIERSLRWGDEIGGHEVSGHVYGTAKIHQKIADIQNVTWVIQCDPSWMKYILSKGFIAVDGSSLTVGKTYPEQGLFYLHLIPETLRLTRFSEKTVNDNVNIEFDHKTKTIVDTVERVLSTRPAQHRELLLK
ncbi:MAG: riboflavin synthase subunit alpha [Legionellaceae bacterium]|nr:riboflavin synthase subunit alpha [Legionellaceae bacterium]